MAALLSPCVDLPLPPDQLEDLVDKAKDFALLHGTRQFFFAL
jgi:hypothetical protein